VGKQHDDYSHPLIHIYQLKRRKQAVEGGTAGEAAEEAAAGVALFLLGVDLGALLFAGQGALRSRADAYEREPRIVERP
jgi:hypothetical protein